MLQFGQLNRITFKQLKLKYVFILSFSMATISLFSQVSENYRHNPYVRDPIEVAELKNNIEITGSNCIDYYGNRLCNEVYVKNKTNNQLWMLIQVQTGLGSGNLESSFCIICLNPNENRKLKGVIPNIRCHVNAVYPFTKTENLKFNVSNRGATNVQVHNGIEFGRSPEISITEEEFTNNELKKKLSKKFRYKVFFDMLIVDDLGNKQVISKSETLLSSNLSSLSSEYIKQYNYSTFWFKVSRIDLVEDDVFGRYGL